MFNLFCVSACFVRRTDSNMKGEFLPLLSKKQTNFVFVARQGSGQDVGPHTALRV
jgi:hypothetical protein